MQLLYKFIFSILTILFVHFNVWAQIPTDSLPSRDTTEVLDSLKQQVPTPLNDSLILKHDSIYNVADTIRQDTVSAATDTIKTKAKKKKPEEKKSMVSDSAIANGFGLFIDFLKFASPLINEDVKYEGGLEITLTRRFRVVAEGGYGLLQPESAIRNGAYQSEGVYGRAGIDFTILADARNYLYIGGRYAISNFEDQGAYFIESPLWPNEAPKISPRNNEARWYEVVLGTEGQLFADLYLGWIFRYRRLLSRDSYELLDVFSIPGYGIAPGKSSLAVNFILKYKFHW